MLRMERYVICHNFVHAKHVKYYLTKQTRLREYHQYYYSSILTSLNIVASKFSCTEALSTPLEWK